MGAFQQFGEQPFLVLAELGDETGQHRGAIAAVAEQPTHLASGQGVIDGRGRGGQFVADARPSRIWRNAPFRANLVSVLITVV